MAPSLSHIFYDIWFNLSPSDLLNNIVDNKVILQPRRPHPHLQPRIRRRKKDLPLGLLGNALMRVKVRVNAMQMYVKVISSLQRTVLNLRDSNTPEA